MKREVDSFFFCSKIFANKLVLSLSLVCTFVSNPSRPSLFFAAIFAALNCLGAVH
jgi:hypothetical protein